MKARPTDLEAIDSSLLSIQDEFREHFGWGLAADLESAHALRAAIEESNVDIRSRAQRARTVAALHRRLVLRATDIALLGAAVTTAEIETALTDNTLLIAADGAEFGATVSTSNPKGPVIDVGLLHAGPLARKFIDLDERVAEMDAQGVRVQALSLKIYRKFAVNPPKRSRQVSY